MTAKHLTGDAPDELPGQGASGGGGSGEANTASNVGTGEGVFKDKVGVDLRFKTLKAGAGIAITPSADELLVGTNLVGVSDGDKGDITVSGSGTVWTVDDNTISNAKAADVPTATFKGRTTAGTGDPEDLTTAQATAMLNPFTSTLKGLAPASGGGTSNFLRADGTWAAPAAGGGILDAVDSNYYLRQNGAWIQFSGVAFTAATLINSWTNSGLSGRPPASYRKIGNLVQVQGSLANGASNTFFVLPVGFRPLTYSVAAPCVYNNAGAFAGNMVLIETNGNVSRGTSAMGNTEIWFQITFQVDV